jgi:hypothetical protein
VAAQTLDLSTAARQRTEAVTGVDSTDGLDITLALGTAVVMLRVTHDCSWRWIGSDELVPVDAGTWLSIPGPSAAGLPASTSLHVRADSSSAAVYVAVS